MQLQDHLVKSQRSSENEPWSLLLKRGVRNHDLGSRGAHGSWGAIVSGPLSGQSKETCV